MKHKQIEKIRRDIKYEIGKIEVFKLKTETAKKNIKSLSDKLAKLLNEKED